MTCSYALRGETEKQYNVSKWIKGKAARYYHGKKLNKIAGHHDLKMYDRDGNITHLWKKGEIDPRLKFEYNEKQDKYRFRYALASKILVNSAIISRRYK